MLDSSPPHPTMACGTEVITMCSVGPLEGGLDIVAFRVVYSTFIVEECSSQERELQ